MRLGELLDGRARLHYRFKTERIISVEGTDGSGKKRQTSLVVDRIRRMGIHCETLDFPHYGNFTGRLIENCLSGGLSEEFRGLSHIFASLPFAINRAEQRDEILSACSDGWGVFDRYVPSNLAYHAAQFDRPADRDCLVTFLEDLEYGVLRLPRPKVVIYLSVPSTVARRAMKREGRTLDVNEEREEFQERVRLSYIHQAKFRADWHIIECTQRGQWLSREVIHDKVWEIIEPLLVEDQ